VCCPECRKLHRGDISDELKVVHKNGIGVDCRLDNLTLISSHLSLRNSRDVDIETGVYWQALQHVVVNPVFELSVGILTLSCY